MVPYLPYHTCYGIGSLVWYGIVQYDIVRYHTIPKTYRGQKVKSGIVYEYDCTPMRQKVESAPYIVSFGDGCKARQRRETDKRIMRGLARPRSNLLVACFALSVWHGMVLYHTSVHDVLECLAPNPQCTSSCPAVATYSPAMTTLAVDAPTRSPDSRRPQLTLTLFRRCPIWGTA